MKTLKDYLHLIPVWMREDNNFIYVYQKIIEIFLDVQETKEEIIKSFNFTRLSSSKNRKNSSLNILASYFNIDENFYVPEGYIITRIKSENNGLEFEITEGKSINIKLSPEMILKSIKFKILRSCFDGTLNSVYSAYGKLFDRKDFDIQFLEKIYEDMDTKEKLPILYINRFLSESMVTTYEGSVPDKKSQEYLDELTLFVNGAFSFPYLGAIIRYTIGGQPLELIWDEDITKWVKSYWKFEIKEE